MKPDPNLTRAQRYARIAVYAAGIFAFIMAVTPSPPHIPGEPDDKVMHMLAFSALGLLAAFGYPSQPIFRLLARLAAFGALIELVQAIPALHRDSDLMDLLADVVAALAALSFTRMTANYLTSRRSREIQGKSP